MKILYLDPIVRSKTSHNYRYYNGVYDELVKMAEVHLCGALITDLHDYIFKAGFKPDVVVFGLGWFNHGFFGVVRNLNIPSICILFKPQNNLSDKLKFCADNKISRILTPLPQYKKYEKATGIKTELFPYGFDPEIFKSRQVQKKYHIGFSGALHENKHYPVGAFQTLNIRTKIGKFLQHEADLNVFWHSSDDKPSRIKDYEEYARVINSSLAWIATPAAFGDITPRYYEAAASNTLLLCQKVEREYEHIFRDRVNCIQFEPDLSNFQDVINWIKSDPDEAFEISTTAAQDFLTNHTWEVRAKQLTKIIQGAL